VWAAWLRPTIGVLARSGAAWPQINHREQRSVKHITRSVTHPRRSTHRFVSRRIDGREIISPAQSRDEKRSDVSIFLGVLTIG